MCILAHLASSSSSYSYFFIHVCRVKSNEWLWSQVTGLNFEITRLPPQHRGFATGKNINSHLKRKSEVTAGFKMRSVPLADNTDAINGRENDGITAPSCAPWDDNSERRVIKVHCSATHRVRLESLLITLYFHVHVRLSSSNGVSIDVSITLFASTLTLQT